MDSVHSVADGRLLIGSNIRNLYVVHPYCGAAIDNRDARQGRLGRDSRELSLSGARDPGSASPSERPEFTVICELEAGFRHALFEGHTSEAYHRIKKLHGESRVTHGRTLHGEPHVVMVRRKAS